MDSSKRKRSSNDHKRNLIDKLEIPEMLDSKLSHIEAFGNKQVIVDGCKGIVEYSQSKIRLNTGLLLIGFSGDDIEIKSFSDTQTVIEGNIVSIEFESMR